MDVDSFLQSESYQRLSTYYATTGYALYAAAVFLILFAIVIFYLTRHTIDDSHEVSEGKSVARVLTFFALFVGLPLLVFWGLFLTWFPGEFALKAFLGD